MFALTCGSHYSYVFSSLDTSVEAILIYTLFLKNLMINEASAMRLPHFQC